LGYARAGALRIDLSEPILNETMRLLREKFSWSAEMAHFTRERLWKIARRITPTETLDVIKEDPSDNRILECAVAANSDFIVSEEKDLLRLKAYGGAQILTIRDFLGVGLPATRHASTRD
jgi:predicted nucleic acid-binding protein